MSGERSATLTPRPLALKRACRDLVEAAGGVEAGAGFCRAGKSQLSDYGNRGVPSFMPIDIVGDLEDLTLGQPGWPHVTGALCRRQGGVFLRLPDAQAPTCQWSGFMAALGKEAGELINGICTDLSNDNDVTPDEAKQRLADAADLVRVAVNLEAALKARAEHA